MTAPSVFVVDGPPGCGLPGKTTFLARQAQLAAAKHGPDGVAIASLTRTAATEIGGRDTGIPAENIGTLHAHAYRALDKPELAETREGLAAFNSEHPASALSGGGGLDDMGDEGKSHADVLHSQVAALRARRVPVAEWTPEQQDHHALWTDYKTQTHRLDFTDLIAKALDELPQHPAMPDVLLLDEAQDFSRLELDLAIQWARHTSTAVIVGDPRQSLYAWRGSDPDSLTTLDATGRRLLEQSHRVPQAAHTVAQAWVGQLRIGAAAYKPTAEAGEASAAHYSLREPEQLIAAAQARLDEDPSATVMVLASCGYMLGPLLAELKEQGVPYCNPYRATHAAWNPLGAAKHLLAYLRPSRAVWGAQARPWTWDDLRLWTEPLRYQGVLPRGLKTFAQRKCEVGKFGETQANETVPQETLGEMFLQDGASNHPSFDLDIDWWADSLMAGTAKSMRYPLEVLARHGGKTLTLNPRVRVGTVHSVKGGEADHVYLSPDLSKDAYWSGWHGGSSGRDSIVRLGYVAATRCKRSLTVLEPTVPEHMPLADFVRRSQLPGEAA